VLAASETLSFVLAILGGSFRLLAKAVLPLAVLFILAACGGSKQETRTTSVGIRGDGYTFDAPLGWRVSHPQGGTVARSGDALVSVTHFPLRRPYDQSQFSTAAKALDAVAARLAKAAGQGAAKAATVTVANRRSRSYRYGSRRIGFVLSGRDEFQLFCTQQQSAACDLLFDTFRLTGPSA
jgi:hypothetical protein